MNKKFKLLIIFSILSLSIIYIYDSSVKNTLSISNYFPSEYVTLIYDYTNHDYNEEISQSVQYIYENKVQIHQVSSKAEFTKIYEVSDKEIKLIFMNENKDINKNFLHEKSNINRIILRAPSILNKTWKTDKAKYKITNTNVSISTPHNNYNCIEVTAFYDFGEEQIYFAPNIGIVKSITNFYTNDDKYILELKQIEYNNK